MTKYDYLYFDIETVGKYSTVDDIKNNDTRLYELLLKLYSKQTDAVDIETFYKSICGLMPEFGKILCISAGYMTNNDIWKVESITGDEDYILTKCSKIFKKAYESNLMLCGFNIINFDMPYMVKKMIKYGIYIPSNLILFKKKPWNLKVLDLCDEWKSTSKYMSSLDFVTYELGIESPKTELCGAQVHDYYWSTGDIEKIATYCNKDVKALVDIVEKFSIAYGNI